VGKYGSAMRGGGLSGLWMMTARATFRCSPVCPAALLPLPSSSYWSPASQVLWGGGVGFVVVAAGSRGAAQVP
jgi:hypothetical protein